MEEKRKQPKKIKLPPLVDRSDQYDTLSFDNDTLADPLGSDWNIRTFWKTYTIENEDHKQNDSEGLQ